jgi:TolB protein
MNAECLSLPEGCGTSLRMLTGEEGTVDEASWSPDNAHIAYVGLEHSEATSGIINVISAEDGTVVNSFEGSSLRWSPDGTQIAFLRPQPDMNFIYDLYVADALGGEVKQLTDGVGNVDAFAWHPLGEEITYVYYELPNNDRTGDLYAINPDSSAVRNITNTGTVGSTFAWSPDGTWVMFADEMGDYYLLNQDGTSHLVADNPEHGFRTAPPKWSPDSTQVVFEFPSSESTLEYTLWTLHAVDVATRTVKDLSPNLDTEGNYSWSPDSTQVVFMGKLNADIEIYTVSPDGSAAPRQLTDYPDYYDTNPIWQPVSG